MTGQRFALAALVVVLLAAPAAPAQQPASRPAPAVTAEIDKLPVSLARIRRELARTPDYEERFEDFRLLTIQHVYGQGPGFELFLRDEPIPSAGGAVRYGGMTHSEFLAQVAPRNFQAPVMNLSGGVMALTNWAAEKRREAQRRKAAEERKKAAGAAGRP